MVFVGFGSWIGVEAPCFVTNHYRGVIGIGREHIFTAHFIGVFDHFEQAALLLNTVDSPGGIKDFVAAVLRVGLRKHHQLYIDGVAAEGIKGINQIINFVIGEGQTE